MRLSPVAARLDLGAGDDPLPCRRPRRVLELDLQPGAAAMEGDVDGVRRQFEDLGDLARAEVGAVAERDELAVLRLEPRDGIDDGEALGDLVREILRRRLIVGLVGRQRPGTLVLHDAGARDADEPAERLPALRVVGRAVANGAQHRLARHVLGVRSGTDAIRNVRVDAPDQLVRPRERVAAHHSNCTQCA